MLDAVPPRTIETWKLDLIRERAKHFRLQPADIDDAVQEIAIEILGFEYRPDPENPATEETVLRSLVDNLLKMRHRSESRYQRRMERVRQSKRSSQRSTLDSNGSIQEPSYCESLSRTNDIRAAMDSLDPTEREVCELLSDGNSVAEIAQLLGCSKTTVRVHLAKVRELFQELGIDRWLVAESREDAAEKEQLLLLSARKAAAMCGKTLRTWRTWDAAGFVPAPVRVGKSTFWRVSELKAWIAAGCPQRDAWNAIQDRTGLEFHHVLGILSHPFRSST